MKKLTYPLFVAMGLSLAASCALDRLEEPADTGRHGQHVILTATAASSGPETRATLLGDGLDLYWSPNDQIRVWAPGDDEWGSTFSSENTEPAQVAEFEYWTENSFSTAGQKWAVYPVPEDWDGVQFHDGKITTTMPSVQTAAAGTFDPKALLAVAGFTGYEMHFSHVCGGLKFSVSREGIREVVLRSVDHLPLAGTVTVQMDAEGHPRVVAVTDSKDAIHLTAPFGESFQPGKWYYMTCLPAVLEHGFTLSFQTDTERGVLSRTEAVEVKRAVWGKLENADAGVTFAPATEPLSNQVWYRKPDNSQLELDYVDDYFWGANYVSQIDRGGGEYALVFDGPVTKVPGSAFSYKGLASFRLPDTVRLIEYFAFAENPDLTQVYLPDGVKSIGAQAFASCPALNSVYIPESVEIVEQGAFMYCYALDQFSGPLASPDGHSLINRNGELMTFVWSGTSPFTYVVPDGVTRLGDHAFQYHGNMTEITLPASLTELGFEVFYMCFGLQYFHGPYASPDGRLLIMDGEIMASAMNGVTNLVIPDNLVKSIAPRAFMNWDGIKTLTIGEGVTSIGEEAFEYCEALEEVTLPQSLTEMGPGVFRGCAAIKSFSGKFATGNHLFLIKDNVLLASAAAKVTDADLLPDTLTEIGPYAFYWAQGISSYPIPASVTKIGECAFSYSNLSSIDLSHVKVIDHYAFNESKLGSLVLPACTSFVGCGIISGCSSITEVTIYAETPPETNYNDPFQYSNVAKIYVPAGSVNAYKEAPGWYYYADLIVAIP